MNLLTLDFHRSGGFTVVTVNTDELPAFVSAVAGVCEIMALAPAGKETLEVGNSTFWANCFTVPVDGVWQWRAELWRENQTTYNLHLNGPKDAEALRRRLAEAAA